MPEIYFTPSSIGYLAQIILSASISIYLTQRLLRRENRSTQSVLLAGFFIVVTLFIGLLFFDAILLPRLFFVYLENTVLGIVLTLILQFAYRFPVLFPRQKWEAYLVLFLSLSYTLYETQYAVYRFLLLLRDGTVDYRPPAADYALVVLFVWIPFAFLRQCVAADSRSIHWLRKLRHPQGMGARGARTFAMICVLLVALSVVNILRGDSTVSTTFYNIALSMGILVVIWLFASAYINYLPERTSFLVKLSGITLTLLLSVLGIIGWVAAPGPVASYDPLLTDHQTLRFTPNTSGGYAITQIPFTFETELGEKLPVTSRGNGRNHKVDFTFPFYGKTYSEIYVTSVGLIRMGQALYHPNLQYHYGRFPGIFPLLVDLEPASGGGVYARVEAERLIVTWDHLAALHCSDCLYTFQSILYRDGSFDITYNGLPDPLVFNPDESASANPWLRGVTPGVTEPVEQVTDLAQASQSGAHGILQDFNLDFRGYIHEFILPLVWLVIASSLALIVGLPFLLRSNLVRPLNALLDGVQRMETGELDVNIPVPYRDEIGFLAQSFNKMAARLRTQMTDLETRVAERTSELAAANEHLRVEMESRADAQAQMLAQQRTLATLDERVRLSRQLHDGLGQVMGYINVQTQAAQALLSDGQSEAAFNSLDRVAQLAQEAHADIRNFILSLRTPASGSTADLFALLEEFVREFSRDSGIPTSLSLPTETPLPALTPAVEEQVLHIIQEALTNVRKHSSAKKAEVWFSFDGRTLQMVVSDDGIGFDARLLVGSERQHFGLSMMRERAEITGGRLEVRSAAGQGTKILASIPYLSVGASGRAQSEIEGILGLRLLLVDDSPIFLEGLRNLLMARGLTVIGTAHDGLEAQEKARELRPDVIVMDVTMPRCTGLEATRIIKAEFPDIKIVMLTVSEEDDHLFEAIQNGASGFLLKGMDANEFCTLLARLTHGEAPLTPGAASRLMSEFSRAKNGKPSTRTADESITERQWQILDLVARGLTYKETGLALHLSEKTVKYHMGQILERLHLKNRTQAIAYARRMQER